MNTGGGSGENAVIYDDEAEDYVPVEGTSGQGAFSYYLLDRNTQYLLFQQTSEIRPGSFAGALRKILDETYDDFVFTADFVTDAEAWSEWLADAERIDRLFVSVRKPNPSWDDRFEAVKTLVEESKAARVSVEAIAAKDGESLEVTGTDLDAFVEYANEGYGEIRARGETVGGRRTEFDSKNAIRTRLVELTSADTLQGIYEKFRSVLTALL